jgi:N-acetylglutamate synthase-like GNAT family acetyltransferase
MQSEAFQIRRATLEDIQPLCQLWKEAQLPALELEKRFTEFQVILDAHGQLLGAIGIHVLNHQGLIHSEAFSHPEMEDQTRPLLWERFQTLAHNFGLLRFWTREESPFWVHYGGLKPASEEELKKLPAGFGPPQGRWLTLALREDHPAVAKIEQELTFLKQAQEAEIERVRRQARVWQRFATAVAVVFFICIVLGCLYLLKMRRLPPS